VPLLPELEPIVEAIRAAPYGGTATPGGVTPAMAIDEVRARDHAMMEHGFLEFVEPGPPIASVDDRTVRVDGGTIAVRRYHPAPGTVLPGYVYCHGGGWYLGTLDHFDAECRWTAHLARCAVVSVGYRLAPEHKFPIAAEDCYAAVCSVVEHARAFEVAADRIAVGGASAGGNLAAVVALMARDRSGPALAAQVLEIPVIDIAGEYPSRAAAAAITGVDVERARAYRWYYARTAADFDHPYCSPLHAPDLGGLPPALVTTAEHDALRDEGEAYAAALARAGVDVTHRRYDGHIHGSTGLTRLLDSARRCRAETAAWLGARLH
jgi:acetyl esterase